jgi:hypothetical protein
VLDFSTKNRCRLLAGSHLSYGGMGIVVVADEALDDGGLADAGISEEDEFVLCVAEGSAFVKRGALVHL